MYDGARSVCDEMAFVLHAQSHFHVLGRVREAPAAEFAHDLCAEERERAGCNENGAYRCENETVENGEAVFDVLHVLEYRLGLFYKYAGRDGRNPLVFKYGSDVQECVGRDDRVGVETADNLGVGVFEAEVHRRMFATVFFGKNAYARIVLEFAEHGECRIGRAVIYKNKFEFLFWILQSL